MRVERERRRGKLHARLAVAPSVAGESPLRICMSDDLKLDRLQQNESPFHLQVDRVQACAIFGLSPDGTIVSWNRGVESL
jgi:hypothetical protein